MVCKSYLKKNFSNQGNAPEFWSHIPPVLVQHTVYISDFVLTEVLPAFVFNFLPAPLFEKNSILVANDKQNVNLFMSY